MGIQLAGKDWPERLMCQSILTLTVVKTVVKILEACCFAKPTWFMSLGFRWP